MATAGTAALISAGDLEVRHIEGTRTQVLFGKLNSMAVAAKGTCNDEHRRAKQEADLLSGLNHQNIVTVYGYCVKGSVSYVVLELARGTVSAGELLRKFPGRQNQKKRVGSDPHLFAGWRWATLPSQQGHHSP
jgi:serine/threonine protein kinase